MLNPDVIPPAIGTPIAIILFIAWAVIEIRARRTG